MSSGKGERVRGRLTFKNTSGITTTALLESIIQGLESKRARLVREDERSFLFSAGLLRVATSWNPLCAISSGKVTVQAKDDELVVSYDLALWQMLAASVLMSGMFVAFMQAHGFSTDFPIKAGCFAFLWFYGGNVLFARTGFVRILKDCWIQCLDKDRKTHFFGRPVGDSE